MRAAAGLGRLYCRHVPTDRGKFAVWKRLFRARLARRDLILTATSSFGGKFRLDLADWIQSSIYAFGEWEPVTTAYLWASLGPGDVFIDIGANIGYHSVLAALKVGPRGCVHAIEASPETFALLNGNLARNSLSNVRTYNVAAADKPGELSLWVRERNNIGRSTVVETHKGSSAILEARVQALPLGAILSEVDIIRARAIKVDVEGAEWLVLQGIKDLLPKLSPQTEILFEVGAENLRSLGASVEECLGLFRDAGFVPWVIDPELNQPFYSPQRAGAGIRPLTDEMERYETIDLIFRRS